MGATHCLLAIILLAMHSLVVVARYVVSWYAVLTCAIALMRIKLTGGTVRRRGVEHSEMMVPYADRSAWEWELFLYL